MSYTVIVRPLPYKDYHVVACFDNQEKEYQSLREKFVEVAESSTDLIVMCFAEPRKNIFSSMVGYETNQMLDYLLDNYETGEEMEVSYTVEKKEVKCTIYHYLGVINLETDFDNGNHIQFELSDFKHDFRKTLWSITK